MKQYLSAAAFAVALIPGAAAMAQTPGYCFNERESKLTWDERRQCEAGMQRQIEESRPIMPGRGSREDVSITPWRPMPPGGWHDPASIDLCPKPHRMTDDGCQ